MSEHPKRQLITQEGYNAILQEFPNTKPEEITKFLKSRGHEIEGEDFEFNRMIGNLGSGVKEFAKAFYSAVRNPDQTLKSVGTLAKGGIISLTRKINPEFEMKEPLSQNELMDEKAFNSFVGTVALENGFKRNAEGSITFSPNLLMQSIERDPVNVIANIGTIVSAGGKAIELVGKAGNAKNIEQIGRAVRLAGKLGDPVYDLSGLVKLTGKGARRGIIAFNQASGFDDFFKARARSQGAKALRLPEAKQKDLSKFLFGDKGDLTLPEAKRVLGANPGQILSEWGVSGTYGDMSRQLGEIGRKTKNLVDKKLASISTTFLNESADDLLEGMGRFLKSKKSQTATDLKDKINLLKSRQLTLAELNEVKRIFDREFPKAFGTSGLPANSPRLGDMAEISLDLRRFIEDKAAEAGISNVRLLNKQTQRAFTLKEIIDDKLKVVSNRSPFVDRMIVAGGTVGSVLTGDPRLIMGAGAFVGAEAIATSPRYRSAFSNALYSLAEKDFKKLEGGITFERKVKISKEAMPILRKVTSKALNAFNTPEGRLTIRGFGKLSNIVTELDKEFNQ